ncbi:hypothetical protein DFQ26_009504 [Actinomortierella ambigua]|nr:hypothetical protein DFQ26_009504 [Actinomortierella ambigua]
MEVMQDSSQTLTTKPAAMDKDILHPGSMDESRSTANLPPELVGLIVKYLDRKDLVKVLTLNWAWAFLAAAQLWETIHLTANSNKIVFLITKSAPIQEDVRSGSRTEDPSEANEAVSTTTTATRRGSSSSYPWPTLLPYHSMVQSLHVSLSSADMVQDLNEIICCCTELRSFAIHSAIPTEDLLRRGAVSMANRDGLDPMDGSSSPHGRQRKRSNSAARNLESSWALHGSHVLRQGDQEAMTASLASQSGLIFSLLANNCPKLERLHIMGFHPVAVLGSATDLRPLPPKFDLDMYRDPLFPTSTSTRSTPSLLSKGVQPLMPLSTPGSPQQSLQFPYTPAPSVASTATTTSHSFVSATTNIPPLPATTAQVHCHVHSLQFVNCTVPPQYLLNMLQHALPDLTELSLMQCWRDAPLGGSFLALLARACPRLKSVSLHATQNHRGAVDSAQVLDFLQTLEDCPKMPSLSTLPASGQVDNFGIRGGVFHPAGNTTLQHEIEAMAELPLGSYRGREEDSGYSQSSSLSLTATTNHHHHHHHHHHHQHHQQPRHGSDVGVQESPGAGASLHSSARPLSMTTVAVMVTEEGQNGVEAEDRRTNKKGPSALESLRMWFTHSILDQEIVRELADRTRHPRLKFVEFGSEDPFDVGEEMLAALRRDRPGIEVSWVCHGDTGDDRED